MKSLSLAPTKFFLAAIAILAQLAAGLRAQQASESALGRLRTLTAITPAYRTEAVRLLLGEANNIAKALSLGEQLPITEKELLGSYVSPPAFAQSFGALGNITTSNYVYYVSVGGKFSFLVRTRLREEYADLRRQASRDMALLDTNAAFGLATQFLAQASMDVEALNRDCKVRTTALTPDGPAGKHFVPVYWVSWLKAESGRGSAASVELFEPTKTLRQMYVNESKYILRKPLVITNRDYLLSQTNLP